MQRCAHATRTMDIVAVGLSSGDIIALDAITGTRMSVFFGHPGGVSPPVFSLDGKLLASGSKDKMVKPWDTAETGIPSNLDPQKSMTCWQAPPPPTAMANLVG